jgi:hypothetical protein
VEAIMARNRSAETENAEVQQPEALAGTEAQTNVNAATAPSTSDHIKMITLKDGTKMPRKDYIRDRWVNGKVSRGQITKELNELNSVENGGDGKKIPYQVVFAVIKKGTPGGPDPVAAPAPAEGEAAVQS